jgi:hypothetical protein
MRNLQIAWLFILFGGLWLMFIDMLYQTVWAVNGVPALSALGGALFLLALSSMLNWLFKKAWEEQAQRKSSNHGDDPAN